MKFVALIQARLENTRLPRKNLLSMADGRPSLAHVVERVRRTHGLHETVVITPYERQDELWDLCHREGWPFCAPAFRADNLVSRHLSVALDWNADVILRVPGDNPFVDPDRLSILIDTYRLMPSIYCSNTTDYVHEHDLWVDGIGGEIAPVQAFEWLNQICPKKSPYREHPHRFFFDRGYCVLPVHDLSIDLDTQDDYEIARLITATAIPDIVEQYKAAGETTGRLRKPTKHV